MTTSLEATAKRRASKRGSRAIQWRAVLWIALIGLAVAAVVRSDLAHIKWVSELSMQGSPAPALEPTSPTGYVLAQRHFLGTHDRGETYRWIAEVQAFAEEDAFKSKTYDKDSLPTGRPRLFARIYAAWLGAVTRGVQAATGESFTLSAERCAIWEPFISHLLAMAGGAWFLGRRYGLAGAAVAAMIFAFYPPVSGQFQAGVLNGRTWALLLAGFAIAANLPRTQQGQSPVQLSMLSAVAAAVSLWLEPACGFPAILICAGAAGATLGSGPIKLSGLRWSAVGATVILLGWAIDRSPWNLAAGELRHIHPIYAAAWIGMGLILNGAQGLRGATTLPKGRVLEVVLGAGLVGMVLWIQFSNSLKGWLYPSVWIRQLVAGGLSPFSSVIDYYATASGAETFFLAAPVLATSGLLAFAILNRSRAPAHSRGLLWSLATVWIAVVVFSVFRVRWSIVAVLLTSPVCWYLVENYLQNHRKVFATVAAVFLTAVAAWSFVLPPSLQRPSAGSAPLATDLTALVHRHFAHWLATHTPPGGIAALAPPELSDSLVYHANARVLMSTAWESYAGHLAATRILSAPEESEAQAVLEGHGLTHVILPSWDKVMPLFVRKPVGETREPLFQRLQRWMHPSYLRPLPYHLPSVPGFEGEQLMVFKVGPAEGEALSLSRLEEYFVEMNRKEPAALLSRVLTESFADDPNAAIARATYYAFVRESAALQRELDRLVADVSSDRVQLPWDRRVQRAIVLALGRRHDLARQEISACVGSATAQELYELTPLQAYRVQTLARQFGITFPEPQLAEILSRLGAELSPAKPKP